MAGYITIRELINNLKAEDLDSPVIYQYYLGEHFNISNKDFAKVAEEFESLIPCLDNSYLVLSEACAGHDKETIGGDD